MAESVNWAADGIAKLAKVEAAEIAPANGSSHVVSLDRRAIPPNTSVSCLRCGRCNAALEMRCARQMAPTFQIVLAQRSIASSVDSKDLLRFVSPIN
jgi:hypothetical protein